MKKRGEPAIAVIIPTGNSEGDTAIRAIVSEQTLIREPPIKVNKKRFLRRGPLIRRIIWGTIKPMKPITPQKATVVAVIKVENNNNINLTL